MLEAWSAINESYRIFLNGNIHFGILFISLLYLYTQRKEDENSEVLIYYCAIFVVTIFFPLISIIITRFIDDLSLVRIFWLIPSTAIVSYAIIRLQDTIHMKKEGFTYLSRFAFLILAIFFIWSNAGFHTAYTRAEVHGNYYHIPTSVIDVVNEVRYDATAVGISQPTALFPLAMIPFIRQYDATIMLPFGGPVGRIPDNFRSTNVNIREIFDMYFLDGIDYLRLVELVKEEKLNYLIIPVNGEINVQVSDRLEIVRIVDDYVIYRVYY